MTIGGTIEGSNSIFSLGGVDITNPTDGQILVYDSSTNTFVNSTGGGSTGYDTIEGQGTPVTQRTTLNFSSSSFTVADDAINDRTNITVTSSGGVTWSVITSSSATMAVNSGYIVNRVATVNMTLPATAAVGDIIELCAINGAGNFRVVQLASQSVIFGELTTTAGTGGSLTSIATGSAMRLLCIIANTKYIVLSSVGNFTIV